MVSICVPYGPMGPGGILARVFACVFVVLLAMQPVRAQDQDPATAPPCHATGENLPGEGSWRCGAGALTDVDLAPQYHWLRFDLTAGEPAPRFFFTRRMAHRSLTVIAVAADGTSANRTFGMSDLDHSHVNGIFRAPLPKLAERPVTVMVRIAEPTHPALFHFARVAPTDPIETQGGQDYMLFLSLLTGMMLIPLMFDIAFWRVLRERFLVWHTALTSMLLLTLLLTSGLSTRIMSLDVEQTSLAASLVLGLSLASAAMFAHAFIEPRKLHPWLRRALPMIAVWVAIITVLHVAFPFALRPWHAQIYNAAYIPMIVVFGLALADALRRGSRAAKLQLIGWSPMFATGIIRVGTVLLPGFSYEEAMGLLYCGFVFETVMTALGVADRVLIIKRQRDRAQVRSRALERRSEQDALTGLLNRHALEEQYQDLRAHGFGTLALIDLDHFKAVNDTFGHIVGDEVLKSVASALQPDEDVLAFRMGGEEFMLLLRGTDALRLAEQRRQAITVRVARDVHQLSRPVTASMGLVELPQDPARANDFSALYERADRLLYEAKSGGRNRTVSERLKVFRPRASERRTPAKATAA